MIKHLTIALTALVSLAFGANAMAADLTPGQLKVKTALESINVGVVSERVTFGKLGRQDLMLQTKRSPLKVIANLKRAYRNGTRLSGGFRVRGWAHVAASNSYNFTVSDGKSSYIAQVPRVGKDARIKILGSVYRYRPIRKPAMTIPTRFKPVRRANIFKR